MDNSAAVEAYIQGFGGEITARLIAMREAIRSVAPDAAEAMSYGLVGYKFAGKPLVYFGGFKNHTGFYATPNGHEAFAEEFSKYKQGKGSVQFPLDQPLPTDLVKRVVEFRKQSLEGKCHFKHTWILSKPKTGKTLQRFMKNGATISGKHVNSGGTHNDATDTLKLSGKDS